ncbi:MAG TPA: site-specific integrase [Cyanobacteria bacterium UBA9971]|nr:site-specific integrase [Cyanobacteria bacterium UBA9971]
MSTVQPIRDKKTIEDIKNILLKENTRNYVLFCAGINIGLRISDILKLKVTDVKDKTHIVLIEEKTNKQKRFYINDDLRNYFNVLTHNMPDDAYIFESKKVKGKPLDRFQAYRIINDACRKAGVSDEIGTHTLRKTFGYHHYNQFKDIAMLQNIFNHSSQSVTLRYIGINDDMIDESYKNFSL